MASILNTDLGELYDQWNQRVAFNEGYRAQQISEARQAGRDAFHVGVDRQSGRDMYFAGRDERMAEARDFLAAEPAAQIEDASSVEPEVIEPDQIGDVTDGEETLGMESCVANETEDLSSIHGFTDDDGRRHYSQEEIDAFAPDEDLPPSPHLSEYHEYLHETRDVGADFVGYHSWHMENYGDFGIR